MPNSNSNISNYDVSKLKNNIKRILKEKNITQTTLACEVGMPQPRISKILKSNDSDCFTVQQLAAIANYLHISVDTLLGIEPIEETKQEDVSLSDVMQKLFEINELSPIKIGTCETEEAVDKFTGEPITKTTHCIFFDNQYAEKLLEEWGDLAALNTETKQKLLRLWQDDTLERNKERYHKWDFRNKREEGYRLACHYLAEYSDEYSREFFFIKIPPTNEEVELLNWYLIKYAYYDFDENDYGMLHEVISELENMIKKDAEELPFP